jgi:hypothetical protein
VGGGAGGEMNQALYAHMNNKRKMKKKINKMLESHTKTTTTKRLHCMLDFAFSEILTSINSINREIIQKE